MAPLHHHFELTGWSEPKVITRFLIIAIVCALCSLATLKHCGSGGRRWRTVMFSVDGQRVVVVGAARSGSRRRSCSRRAARDVILTDLRPALEPEHDIKLREAGRAARTRRAIAPDTLSGADLIVLSPGVLANAAGRRRGPRRGHPGDRRDWNSRRAGCAAASSPSPAPRASRRRRR